MWPRLALISQPAAERRPPRDHAMSNLARTKKSANETMGRTRRIHLSPGEGGIPDRYSIARILLEGGPEAAEVMRALDTQAAQKAHQSHMSSEAFKILQMAIDEAKRREEAPKPIRAAFYSRKEWRAMKAIVAKVGTSNPTVAAMPRQQFMDILRNTAEQLGLDPSACYAAGHFKQLGLAVLVHMAINSSLEPSAQVRACICFAQSANGRRTKQRRGPRSRR